MRTKIQKLDSIFSKYFSPNYPKGVDVVEQLESRIQNLDSIVSKSLFDIYTDKNVNLDNLIKKLKKEDTEWKELSEIIDKDERNSLEFSIEVKDLTDTLKELCELYQTFIKNKSLF